MLQYICNALHQDDIETQEKLKLEDKEMKECEKFINFKADFDDCYFCLKVAFEDVKKESNKAANLLTANKNQFENLMKIDPDIEDLPFGKQISKFLVEQEPKVNNAKKAVDDVSNEFAKTCDLFMLAKSDEKRAKSEKLFAHFTEFFNQVHTAMPKIEKPKPAKKNNLKTAANKINFAA